MIIKKEDLLLKESVKLYDNIARSGDCNGRLSAFLNIFPAPKITWEFESIGEDACEPNQISEGLIDRFEGSRFSIEQPYLTGRSWGTLTNIPRVFMKGNTSSCFFGDRDLGAHSVRFFLANCRFLERNIVGQGMFEEIITAQLNDDRSAERSRRSAGRVAMGSLDEIWSLSLETTRDALSWLESKKNNVGSYLTTIGHIYHSRSDNVTGQEADDVPQITIEDARSRLDIISLLLSFANGGDTGPIYIEAFRTQEGEILSSEMILAYRTTPLEQVGFPWVAFDSNLTRYFSCYASLNRMLNSPPWSDIFDIILVWYFQAIQPLNAQSRGKPWPVVASAIGAALERLGVAIVVDEFNERSLDNRERLERLLELIGISNARGFQDTQYVNSLIDIRNDATHPRPSSALSTNERNSIIDRGIQWIEEILLWRLGYEGRYIDRTARNYASIDHRYDLSTRLSTW